MTELILHHYDFSNYSEKIRVALGFKKLAWKSAIVLPVLPKPFLIPLTGGYRRAPVLQIGADVYCDTRLIVRELERRFPEPTLFPRATDGIANAISAWAEGPFFRSVMLYAWGTNHDVMPAGLSEDRARMRGLSVPSTASVEKAATRNAPLVRAQLPFVENILSDGRTWCCGEAFTVADLSVYHALWFLTDRSDRLAHELQSFEATGTWLGRVRSLGHGTREEIKPIRALQIAREALPDAEPRTDLRHAEDPPYGGTVAVSASDYAKDRIVGRLEFLGRDEIAVRIANEEAGEVVVHFPRLGYEMREITA